MKGVLLFLLLCSVVVAESNPIPRYTDFPLDNIHILRLQEAAESIGNNVSVMSSELKDFELRQSAEVRALRSEMQVLQQSTLSVLNKLSGDRPSLQAPVSLGLPSYVVVLLSVNVVLLLLVIILIFWLREQYLSHKEESVDHIHPAPDALIDYVSSVRDRRSLSDIRMELASKGWSPAIIEHAVQASKHRKNVL